MEIGDWKLEQKGWRGADGSFLDPRGVFVGRGWVREVLMWMIGSWLDGNHAQFFIEEECAFGVGGDEQGGAIEVGDE